MSTDLYPDPKLAEADGWRSSLETAPSLVRADEPKLARLIATCSASLLILSLFIFFLHAREQTTLLGPLLGQFIAWTGAILGVGGLLFHAARDRDEQVRFMYMLLGYALIAGGVIASLVPKEEKVGYFFLPFAVPAFALGLLFQLAYVRHETDAFYAKTTRQVLGGLGMVMALWGFIQGSISLDFLLPQGVLLILYGLVYLGMFVNLEGVASDLGYRVAQGIGLIGGVVCLLALGRAALISYGTLSAESGYQFMPGGVVLLALGFLYLAVSAIFCSDSVVVVLAQREFVRYFYSPIAYAVLVGFTLIGWVMFMQFVFGQLWVRGGPSPVIEPAVWGYIVSMFPIICVIVLVPVLTMASLSEEQRTGTLEVMLTSPVNEPAIVISKVLGALFFYLLIWIPWGLYLVALRVEGGQAFDYRPVLGFYVVLGCTGMNFLSMGVFFSSLTRNQIVAAVLTFAGMLGLLLLYFLKEGSVFEPDSPIGMVLTHIGFIDLWIDSLRGKVAPRDLLLHVSAAIFWCFVTVKVLESRNIEYWSSLMSSSDNRPQGDWLDGLNRNRQTLSYLLFGLAAACAIGTLVLVLKFKLDYAIEVLILAVTALAAISGGIWLVTQPTDVSRRDSDRLFALFAGGFLGLMVTLYGLMLMLRWRSTLLGGTEQWQGEEGWRVWTSLSVFFIGLGVMFLGLMTAREEERSNATLRRLVYGYNAVLTSLLVLAILIVINILGYLYLPVVTDWTADQLYTISPESRRVLEALEKPVKVFVLQSGRDPAAASDTRNLLANFQSISSKLQVEYIAIHRQLDRQAELVNRYSLIEVEGVLVVVGNEPKPDHRFIKEEDLMERPQRRGRDSTEGGYTYKGEDAIITVLDYLSRGKLKPAVYFTQGNGELELADMSTNRLDRGLSALRDRLQKGNHEVKGLQLGPAGSAKREDPNTVVADQVPEDAAVVVIAGPHFQFPAETLKALTEYMNRTDPKTGAKTGRMIILFDVHISREGTMTQTGLEKWLENYNVEVGNGRILSAVPDPVGRVYPTRIVTTPNERLAGNDIVKGFKGERFAMHDVRPVRPLKEGGSPMQQHPFRAEELLQTIYRRTWVETNLRVAPGERVGDLINSKSDELDRLGTGPISVAVAVSDSGSLPNDAAHRGVAPPAGKPRMVVFGDASLACNAIMHESSGMIYYDFFASCIGWLGERPQNIGIKAKKRDLYTMDQKTNLSRLIFLPLVLILAGAVGLGTGVWVVRRR